MKLKTHVKHIWNF